MVKLGLYCRDRLIYRPICEFELYNDKRCPIISAYRYLLLLGIVLFLYSYMKTSYQDIVIDVHRPITIKSSIVMTLMRSNLTDFSSQYLHLTAF